MLRPAAFVVLCLLATARTGLGAEPAVATEPVQAASPATPVYANDTDWSLGPRQVVADRGALLPSLYVSLAALNALDAYSTLHGVNGGRAAEANPLMRGVAGNSGAMWAVKGGATAASIYAAERLWRKNRRVEAVAVMLVSNGVMAAVAAHNASVLRGVR